MDNQKGRYPQGASSEPFFDLLQPSVLSSSTPKDFQGDTYPGSSKNGNSMDELSSGGEPSYDFQSSRKSASSPTPELSIRSSGGVSMRPGLGVPGQSNVETYVTQPLRTESKKEDENEVMIAAVERTMKKYADNLLHALEDISGRLQHLESTATRLEMALRTIQQTSGDSHGEVDGRVRSLENLLREVQRGVQVIRDKQEIAETQAELAKMQLTASAIIKDPTPETHSINSVSRQSVGSPHTSSASPPPVIPQTRYPPVVPQSTSVPSAPPAAPAVRDLPSSSQVEGTNVYLPMPPALPAPPVSSQGNYQIQQQPQHPPQQQLQPNQPAQQQQQALPNQPSQQQLQLQVPAQQQQQPQLSSQHQQQTQHQEQQPPQQVQQQHQQPQQQMQQQQTQQVVPPQGPPPGTSDMQMTAYGQQQGPPSSAQVYMQDNTNSFGQQGQRLPPVAQYPGAPPPPRITSPLPPAQQQSLPFQQQLHQPQQLQMQHSSHQPDAPPPYLPAGYGGQQRAPHTQQGYMEQQQQQQPPPPPPSQPQPQPQQTSQGMGQPPTYDSMTSSNQRGGIGLPPPPYMAQPQMPPLQMQQAPVYEPSTGLPPPLYTGPASTPGYRVAQPVSSSHTSSGGGYPRLQLAQPVQHSSPLQQQSLPGQSAAGGGAPNGAPLSTSRVPIDKVIDDVAAMGFSKEQVRSVVRRLTENGQSVDLNVVLDKLMNGGIEPAKGWFGR